MLASISSISLLLSWLAFSVKGTREPLTQYKAEGLFLIDDKTVRAYMEDFYYQIDNSTIRRQKAIEELHKDFNYTLSEVNKLFKTLINYTLNITVLVKDVVILDPTTIVNPNILMGSDNGIDAKETINKLRTFVEDKNYYTTYKYDFVLFYTGFDLHYDTEVDFDGFSNLGYICEIKDALGVVEFSRTYRTVIATAHQIAHILGSGHDGAAFENIMAFKVIPKYRSRWSFTNCSAIGIKDNIKDLRDNCLLRTDSASYRITVNLENYQGRILNIDEICRRTINDSRAYMNREHAVFNNTFPYGDKMCKSFYCRLPYDRDNNVTAYPSEGMVCDVGKGCSKGRCVLNIRTDPNITSDCVYGDQPPTEKRKNVDRLISCEEYLDQYGKQWCYRPNIYKSCCVSCKARRSGISGCQYGNWHQDCEQRKEEMCSDTEKSKLCCDSCRNYTVSGKRSADHLDTEPLPRYEAPQNNAYQFNRTVLPSDDKKPRIIQGV